MFVRRVKKVFLLVGLIVLVLSLALPLMTSAVNQTYRLRSGGRTDRVGGTYISFMANVDSVFNKGGVFDADSASTKIYGAGIPLSLNAGAPEQFLSVAIETTDGKVNGDSISYQSYDSKTVSGTGTFWKATKSTEHVFRVYGYIGNIQVLREELIVTGSN